MNNKTTVTKLKEMFQQLDDDIIEEVVEEFEGDCDQSIEALLDLVGKMELKDDKPSNSNSIPISNNNNGHTSSVDSHKPKQPRDYQKEILERGMKENVIAFLPTGAGKTLISAKLAQYIHDKNPNKKILFIVDRVNLVYQQSEALSRETTLKIGKIHGESSNQEITDSGKCDVIAMTAQVVYNMMEAKRLSMSNISLLIFDESHHVTKGHPFNEIMKTFYFTMEQKDRPKVFGMTASPGGELTLEATIKKIGQLCLNMNSQIAMPIKYRGELSKYVNIPKLDVIYADFNTEEKQFLKIFEDYINQLLELMKEFHFPDMPQVQALGDLWEFFKSHKSKEYKNSEWTILNDHMHACLKSYIELVDFGAVSAVEAMSKAIEHLKSNWGNYKPSPKLSPRLTSLLNDSQIVKAIKNKQFDKLMTITCDKTVKLEKVLNEYKSVKDVKIIIFVQTRLSAKLLTDYLNGTSLSKNLKVGHYIGHGTVQASKLSINKLKSLTTEDRITMKTKEQQEVERKFRNHELNVLVATSVAEEGLDVPSCNCVIRYDEATSVTAWIQSRGRARSPGSRFIVIARNLTDTSSENQVAMETATGMVKKIEEFKLREENMKAVVEKIMTGEDLYDTLDKALKNQKKRTFVEKDAIKILNEFCQEKGFAPPVYIGKDTGNSKIPKFSFEVHLPLGIYGFPIEGEDRRDKKSAKNAVAYKACTILQENDICNFNKFGAQYIIIHGIDQPSSNPTVPTAAPNEDTVSKLNLLCQKYRLPVPKYDDDPTSKTGSFIATCEIQNILKVSGSSFPNKKDAKKSAANEALDKLINSGILL